MLRLSYGLQGFLILPSQRSRGESGKKPRFSEHVQVLHRCHGVFLKRVSKTPFHTKGWAFVEINCGLWLRRQATRDVVERLW